MKRPRFQQQGFMEALVLSLLAALILLLALPLFDPPPSANVNPVVHSK